MKNKDGLGFRIFASVLIFIALVGGSYFFVQANRDIAAKEEAAQKAANNEYNQLIEQRETLIYQISCLQAETNQLMGYSSAVLVVTDTSQEIMTNLMPIINEYGYVGVVTLTLDYFDREDALTKGQIKTLIDQGWDVCVTVNNSMKIRTITDAVGTFTEMGIKTSTAYYYEDDRIIGTGIPITGCSEENFEENLKEAIKNSNVIGIGIGSVEGDIINTDSLRELFDYFEMLRKEGKLEVEDIPGMGERMIAKGDAIYNGGNPKDARVAELKALLEETEARIAEIEEEQAAEEEAK